MDRASRSFPRPLIMHIASFLPRSSSSFLRTAPVFRWCQKSFIVTPAQVIAAPAVCDTIDKHFPFSTSAPLQSLNKSYHEHARLLSPLTAASRFSDLELSATSSISFSLHTSQHAILLLHRSLILLYRGQCL
jgi:hypothetical protein